MCDGDDGVCGMGMGMGMMVCVRDVVMVFKVFVVMLCEVEIV